MAVSEETVARAREMLGASLISDVLDTLGYREHAMAPNVRPLDDASVMFGRARTGLYMPVYHVDESGNPYELEMELIDDLKPGEIPVFACPDNDRVGPWGELLSTAAVARGAVGCVMDGIVRDIKQIRTMGFPVFAGAIGPLDSKGRGMVMRIDVPVVCGGTDVASGDWLFGDADGVVVIPQAMAEETITLALDKAAKEDVVRDEIAAGASLKEVFARHGIL